MGKIAKLQVVGPLFLIIAIVAAELSTYGLALRPTSEIAWYINLQVFSIFQRSHYVLSDHFTIPYFQLLFVAAPLLSLTCFGLVWRRMLFVAIASNLSLIYVCFLAYAWHMVETPSLRAASLAQSTDFPATSLFAISFSSGPHIYVLIALLVASLLSFSISHFLYFRAVRQI